ncbi:hypothetical protein OG806_08220 [Streptomyces sp. NBC_00882]|uniref:hypothetical protein n=1 Tax=Streptomyces sp. NBC_00882 TaxID=2975856 RepID=UPI00386564A7|nr:hypothetical protein OG806_08220 [Streptomyces sp. NBC_00882]
MPIRLDMKMRATLRDELSNLASEKEQKPVAYLQQHCRVLLRLVSDVTGVEDAEKVTVELLQEVADAESGSAAVRGVADLLVLNDLSTEEKRSIYNNYDRKDKPITFDPYGYEMRKITAVRHVHKTHSWLDRNKREWVAQFIDGLCDLLANEYPSAFLALASEASFTSRTPSAELMACEPDAHKETSRPTIRSRIARRFKRE